MVVSRIDSIMLRRPRAPVRRAMARVETDFSASSVKFSFTPSISNRRPYCLISAFFGLVRISISAASSRSSKVATTGRRPINSGYQPEFQQILRLHVAQNGTGTPLLRVTHIGAEPHARSLAAGPDNFLQAGKSAAANEQNVRGIHLQEFLLRMLSPALRRHRGHRAFHDFQQRLLHTLAAHIAG